MKRLFDFVLSAIGLLVLAPFFVIFSLLIWLTDWGPVFFVQTRVGRGGRPFRMLKFRSMRVGSDLGSTLTIGADKRITKIGHLLRRGKVDELPQLWNVFIGDMSLVGPRPEIQKYVDQYSSKQLAVLELKPGITDPASFALYDESDVLSRQADPEKYYVEHLMGEKIRINLEYAARASLATDVLLVLSTVGRMFGLKLDIFSLLKIQPIKI